MGVTFSYQRSLREDLDIFGWVSGIQNTTTIDTGLGTTVEVESEDPAFEIGFEKKFARSEFSLRGGRTLQTSSSGNLVLRDGIRAALSRDVSERTALDFTVYAYESESVNLLNAQTAEQEYRRFTGSLSWRWTQRLTLSGGYEYTWRQLNGEVDSSDDHTVFLGLKWHGLDPRQVR